MTAFKGLGTYGNAVGVVTPGDHKMADAGLISKTALNAVRPGLFWGGTATIVSGTAGMSYSVAAYNCVTTRGATAGVVLGGNDGTLSVATTAAPGSNSRYDVVYHWHREYSLDGTDSNPVIGVVQGTSAASPTVPSLAAYPGAIELARILVPAGVTATNTGTTITQTAPFTALDGGKIVVRTTTERDAVTTPFADLEVYCLADLITYKYSGSAWKEWESDWISYIPTLTNITLGSGTKTGQYQYREGRVFVEGRFTYGAGSAVATGPTVTHPASLTLDAATHGDPYPLGRADVLNSGIAVYPGFVTANGSTTTALFNAVNTSGTYGIFTAMGAAIPLTFEAADVIAWKYDFIPA